MKCLFVSLLVLSVVSGAYGKVDLVTLPARDTVQLTIYNSADMTLARESRALTLKEGENALQFSWENTLIDPTSLEMAPRSDAGGIDIAELVYPPRVKNLGVWNVRSAAGGKVPVEISYLTSGLSWRAFYMGTLTHDEKTMRLQAYVRVTNKSGEDYENAQVRLIVGKVHLLDEIAALARREYPYGRPERGVTVEAMHFDGDAKKEIRRMDRLALAAPAAPTAAFEGPKQIVKEGLSEYFLYTIEGTETIPNGWSKRLLSFDIDAVPVVNLYKFEHERYGASVVRFLSFKNDQEHKLGKTPIPGGTLKVYRAADAQEHLSYTGQSSFKYIPVDEDVELSLGHVSDIVVEPKLMEYRTDNYRFDPRRNISGWDEIQVLEVTAKNTRDIPVKVEIRRNFPTTYWTLQRSGQVEEFEKVDQDTVKFSLLLQPRSERRFQYTLTTYNGVRTEDWTRLSQ
ncbi:MAG: DUF4139 domain-containing protein [Planctomycetes bacterium]|jgi:hypothetical protein|nr:DUF4139 domain-containing protein [Planctomycetota bacterium]